MACAYPFYSEDVRDIEGNLIPIPCGRCFSCRLDIQRSFIDRMFCAWHSHDVAAFVTFTYDDDHLLIKDGFRQPTLSKEHVHKYLDNIRHQIKIPFEYFLAGEYGDRLNRPHYHALFFGLDYQLHKQFFMKSWKYGSVMVLPVKQESFRYVAKYVVKPFSKDYNDKQFYDIGLIPPFHKLSRGLGLSVYLSHLDDLRTQGYFIYYSRRISVNRYYFNKLVGYSRSLLESRERVIDDRRRQLSKDASVFNLSSKEYEQLKIRNRESALASKNLNSTSSLM